MISVFVPYVNRPDLLKKAVDSVPVSNMWQVEVINNSGGPLLDNLCVRQCEPPVPLNFSQTQNWMLKLAKEGNLGYYFFMHSDAEAGEGSIHKLAELAGEYQREGRKWGAIFTNYDALAAFNTEAMSAIGGWDPRLTWYLSDCDCYRRLRLAGYPTFESNLPVKHTPSQTLNSDPEIKLSVEIEVPLREYYYSLKWGGPNEREKFLTPFNR